MKKLVLFLPLLIIALLQVNAQEEINESYAVQDTLPDFGLFANDDLLELSLRFNVTEYTRKKPKDEYLDAILTYHISPGDSINKDVRLKTRGEFRNGYCSFPPLLLNFKKTEFEKQDLNKIGKMKVVTHCQSGNEDILFREYLIYKLYNVLTDSSFRVRLVKINYINTFKQTKTISSYAFFIEPIDLLAERMNSMPVELTTLSQKNIVPEMMDRMAIFNYMIGNTDWSVPNQHNCKILVSRQPGSAELGQIVPYDFDYSGLVNASYAIPHEDLGIETVRERLYLGLCRSEDEFLKVLQEFSEKKQGFYDVINEFPYLTEKEKKSMIQYLDQFYSGFDKRNSIVYYLRSECKDY
ncbi:MAG: hypothetical protein MUC78_10815 [Bacteroidales bacterium]|jgi:hypothetical protein|nr:hypothetical protein [Bacteroidales bacterium]